MKTTSIAARLITGACLIQILGYFLALPGHIGDPTWSAHAQFHLLLSWFWLTGLNILILVLVWGPLQRGERWSFWATLIGYVAAQGGHFLTMLLVWEGRPFEAWFHLTLGVNAVLGGIGLVLYARQMRALSRA